MMDAADSRGVLVIGAGRMGSGLAQELCRTSWCDRIFIRTRSSEKDRSLALSLDIYSRAVGSSTRVAPSFTGCESQCDVVLICVKEDYDPRVLLKHEHLPAAIVRDVRTIGLRRDVPIVADVAYGLRRYRGDIFVATNPVEVISALVKTHVPHANVIGLGLSLDCVRMAYALRMRGVLCDASDVPLGGSHLLDPVVLRSAWNSRVQTYDETVGQCLAEARKMGLRIVRGLGYTLHDCLGVFARDLRELAAGRIGSARTCASIASEHSCRGGLVAVDSAGSGPRIDLEHLTQKEIDGIEAIQEEVGRMVSVVKTDRRFGFFFPGKRR